MNVLVVDIGGSNVKILATGQTERRRFPSGPTMTPDAMAANVKELAADWSHDAVAIGYPGRVRHHQPIAEPKNLGAGWVSFDFAAAFGRPVRMVNDAAMQALGCYQGGSMLFMGLGTGLGTAIVVEGVLLPLELAHLAVRRRTFEDDLGARGLERLGRKRWEKRVFEVTARFMATLLVDEVVIGGGNAKKLTELPAGCRLCDNSAAFVGGFKLWERDEGIRDALDASRSGPPAAS